MTFRGERKKLMALRDFVTYMSSSSTYKVEPSKAGKHCTHHPLTTQTQLPPSLHSYELEI